MLILYKFQECNHIRSTEMIDRLQTGKHTTIRYSLEMILANILLNLKID